jgi:hypothetical protein
MFLAKTYFLGIRPILQSSTYISGPYHIFRIFDPKEKTIECSPFRDRVVHHAIVDVFTIGCGCTHW